MGFDGIDEVVLPAHDLTPLRSLYVDLLGFEVAHEENDPDPELASVWSLPASPTRTLLLGKVGSAGGWIRLAQVPGLTAPSPAGRPDRSGPYALDFYLREPATTEAGLERAGYPYRAPAARYPLPSRGDLVHERILDQPHSGLIHATIGYRSRGTRCVLDDDPGQQVSEVGAVVFCSRHYERAIELVERVLGATAYLAGEFGGPQLEPLLGLHRDEVLPMTLFRGPTSRNARLEICAARLARPPRPEEAVPRATASCFVDDLDDVASRIRTRDGRRTPILDIRQDGRSTRRLGLRTVHGLSLDLVDAAGRRS